jgi:hypothetical protein
MQELRHDRAGTTEVKHSGIARLFILNGSKGSEAKFVILNTGKDPFLLSA